MRSMTPNRRTLVRVEVADAEKRRVPSKHYSYVINVTWSDQSETVIYRRYSKFFEFQIILLETFPWEGGLKEPSARIIPFLPGKILFRRSHIRDVAMKRLKPIDEYCKALILLPHHISRCDHVLDFFEPRQEDFNPIREESSRRRKDEQEIGEISGPLLLEPYIAIADYNSTQQKELTISVGQRLEVIEKNENGWWFVSDEEGERGWVPGVYLEKPDGTSEDLVTKRAEPGHGEHYVTTNGYTAENADDISFGAGVVVEVLQKNLEGWWLVSYNGKQGFAPASYLEKSHNWVPESRGVEIISSIRDLKQHRHSLPSNSLQTSISLPSQRIISLASRSKDTDSISETPLSPVSPTYKKEKTVQPPPKRSSVKRMTKKRPGLPPPLPPTVPEEPTYEYMTIAQFDSTIHDGVSFNEEKKVQVLEKSPGGWWFVKIDGEEGWAPASYIEKREAIKAKVAPPSRPKPPMTQKNSSDITPTKHFSPVRKVPSVPSAIMHPILEKNSSVPSSFSQSSLSPANRPLPPLPKTMGASQPKEQSETYEEVGSSQPRSETPPPKAPRVPSALPKNSQHSAEKPSESTVNSGPIDFRSVLKSSIAAKHTEIKNKSNNPSPKPSSSPSKGSSGSESIRQSSSVKSRTETKPIPPKLPTAKKPTAGRKDSNPQDRPSNFRKPSTNKQSSETTNQAAVIKPAKPSKFSNDAPKLPLKPKPSTSTSNSKPGFRNMSSTDDGAVTDFRSVLRSKERKQSETANGVGRSHSFSSDRVLSTKTKDKQSKPPSLPKKPGNLPVKPASTTKPSREDSTVKPSAMKKTGTTRPPWNAGTKPVLRRYQNNNNSNSQEPAKKPVFTVGHAQIEISHPPGLREILTKRGSPDGQVDVKFVDGGKENRNAAVMPPERKKKTTRQAFEKDESKSATKTSQPEYTHSNLYITVSSYTGVEESEISFDSGVKAEVLNRAENDWWYVKVGNNIGWAPSSFFRPVSASDFPEKASYVTPDQNHQQEEYYDDVYAEIPEGQSRNFPAPYIAAADFEASQSSTLSLRVGERVTVTQEAEGGWWYAILSSGEGEGWVPSSYLDPAS